MVRVTAYLPRHLKDALHRAAQIRGFSEAQVIRDSLESSLLRKRQRPRGGLYASGDPIAHRVDELLAEGFGEW